MTDASALQLLRQNLSKLEELSEAYRSKFFGRRLAPGESEATARVIIVEIRQQMSAAANQWAEFSEAELGEQTLYNTIGQERFDSVKVNHLMARLMRISEVGTEMLSYLDRPVAYTLHYQRQCSYVEGSNKLIQEDAAELQVAAEQIARQARDDVNSVQAQIHLVSVYSQTVLSDKITNLTRQLVWLTAFVFFVSLIAAVAGLIAVVG